MLPNSPANPLPALDLRPEFRCRTALHGRSQVADLQKILGIGAMFFAPRQTFFPLSSGRSDGSAALAGQFIKPAERCLPLSKLPLAGQPGMSTSTRKRPARPALQVARRMGPPSDARDRRFATYPRVAEYRGHRPPRSAPRPRRAEPGAADRPTSPTAIPRTGRWRCATDREPDRGR
jgi:hypothetical protein